MEEVIKLSQILGFLTICITSVASIGALLYVLFLSLDFVGKRLMIVQMFLNYVNYKPWFEVWFEKNSGKPLDLLNKENDIEDFRKGLVAISTDKTITTDEQRFEAILQLHKNLK